jgi:PKD repeat protein
MRKFTILLTLVVAICSAYAQKSWVSFTSEQPEQAAITILQSDRAGLTIEVTVPGMFSEQIVQEENTFQRISLIEDATTRFVGRPELPMLHELIGIPDNLAVSYTITEIETTKLSGYNIYPFQTPTTDNPGGHDREFVIDEAFYSKFGNFPAENVVVDQPNIWRDVKVSGIHVTPFTYNPATQELEVITHMTVEIEFAGSDNSPVLNRSKALTPQFYNMYQNAISNFGDLGYTETLRDTPGIKYLIITNTEALDAIQPLVDYKNAMGHRVEVKTLETGFNQPQQFKDYISDLYDSDGLEYVLMVGDAYPNGGSGGGPNIVPMYWWAPGGEDASYSDSWYSCLDGPDDHYADLAIGRFVYNNGAITELELQIDKTMTHYLTPDVSDNWAENTILIAHKEQYPGKYTQCCEEIRTYNYDVQIPIFETAYGGAGASNADVVNFVNNSGVGIFNYRGHGSDTELWEWGSTGSFTATHVAQLNNVDKLFVFFDVCCDNMNIVTYSGTCLCESFMKHPTGSVAVNGAIIPSYTIPNHDYDKEMYKAVFDEDITNIGYVTNFANLTVLNVHGNLGRSNVRTYLWLGDASIEPWTLQPMNLTVTHDEQIFLGFSEYAVNVIGTEGPVENAMVCVSNEDASVYAVAYTDASGMATVTFDEPVQTPGNATVTVTRHNYLPYQATVPIIPQDGPYVVKDSYIINDAAGGNGNGMMDYAESILLTLSVKNVGIVTAEDVVVTLSTEDEYVTITDGEESYGDVEPDAVVTVDDGFAFDVAEDLPDGHAVLFDVSASDGTDTWTSSLVITGHAPLLELGEFIISDPTGNNNGKVDPGETVQISVYVNNTGSADAYEVMGELMTGDMFLTINTADPLEYGDISAEGMAMATFEAYADESTPAGHMVELELDITADHSIAGNGMFNIVVGQIPVVVIDLDPNNSSGPAMQEAIEELGVAVEYTTTMPADLNLYSSAFVCLGIYSSNHVLSSAEGLALAGLLDAGGSLYMEGGDTWYYDASTAVHPYFNINGTSDGSGDLGTINGQAGTFTEGLSYNYSGENNWIDHIVPSGDAVQIFMNASPSYGNGVAYDEGSYTTIGCSFEFGGLDDSDATRTELMQGYLEFFGIIQSGVLANFVADETDICEGEEVQFTDYSVGGTTEWAWEFEGGTPATSTEQNPIVMYYEMGEFDVTLTVTGASGSNTMTKNDYINTMAMPATPENMDGEEVVCQGNTDVYTCDEVAYASSYVWVLDPPEAGTLVENGAECTITWSDQVEGMATLKVCGINECGEGPWSGEYEVLVQNCTGIEDNADASALSIYPNPNTGSFTLELNANDQLKLKVINTIGEVVYKIDQLDVNGFYVKSIDLNKLAEGVYYLRLEGNTLNKTEKIVISR